MSDSFSLPLRPVSEKRERPDPLPVEIAQINAQYGSFRDVTEDSLRAKIEADKNKDPWADEEESDKASVDEDTTERLDQLYKRRAAINQFAHQAHMEAMFALDFVSLLLSKHTPRQAEMSMSAYLKQVAPLGSLNAEIVSPPPKPDSAATDIKTVSRGWRMQNFNAAANKLLDSANRLETEVTSETKYWNEVLAVKEKGWKVCRLPRERQALGVQYGFLEATPIFRDRGLAALRRTNDGSLILDKGLVPPKARTVRVRVRSRSQITGCSKRRPASDNAESVESRILQARDTVYEEELFHELVREARILGSQGVTTRQNLVQFPVSKEQEVLLDLVDDDQGSLFEDEGVSSHEHDVVADALAHGIRILLAHAHRQNLRRRTQPPPPLVPKRRQTPEYQLLRPVMAYLQHSSQVRWLESLFKDIHQVLKSAGITWDFTATPFSSLSLKRANNELPKVETLVQEFLLPYESTFAGQLVAPQSSFRVKVRTNVTSPPFGTHYEISVHMPQYPDVRPPNRIGLQDEAAFVLTHFVLLDILTSITQAKRSPLNGSKQETDRRLTWDTAYPHSGELLALSSTGLCKKMKVSLSRHELTVQVYSVGRIDALDPSPADQTPAMRSQTWKLDGTPGQCSLMDFVAEVSKE
ncbi:mediator of RNA polymerase II transcription subunit 17 [Aspergillus coremiiformis]|uniref:Mediator of RNA polymerase II transcription subunit 17 n=1 Tax=Aspergillus coremiiformis TaxID=138285 RepID=A0A5N6Z3Z4_9EURO|nr:mediator of RNA polymerase II transcription subunit 17 [Aspergillus coremiiformis]